MDEKTFKLRTKKFALDAIRLIENLPRSRTGDGIAVQILRSATSVGANYRAACRAKSTADMINSPYAERPDGSLSSALILTETFGTLRNISD